VTSSCILISRHDHVLIFISIYLQSILLTSNYYSFSVFLYSTYASAQYINVISLNQKLISTISFQAILLYLNPPNGVLEGKVKKQWR
jgi:hypothetical protein